MLRRLLQLSPIVSRLDNHTTSEDMKWLHATASSLAFRHHNRVLFSLIRLIDKLMWPTICSLLVARLDRDEVRSAANHSNLSVESYLNLLAQECVDLRIRPNHYIVNDFSNPDRRNRCGDWLSDIENYRIVGKLLENVDISILNNKYLFDRFCLKSDFARAEVLAVVKDGTITELDGLNAFAGDIFAKPISGNSGYGAQRWRLGEGGRFSTTGGQALTEHELRLELTQLCQAQGTMVIQRVIENDKKTRALSRGALSTLRIMTGRFADGQIVLIAAFFRMGQGAMVVDNYSSGGLLTTVDVENGKLSAALEKKRPHNIVNIHPDTGHKIEGFSLPNWEGSVSLCISAHRLLPEFTIVSWDVASTEEGPIFIEANHMGNTRPFQGINGRPIGDTPYAAVVRSHAPRMCRR